MKRTNLVLDEQLLKEAVRSLGVKTYSDAVNRSLEETIKILKIRAMISVLPEATWIGDLSEMRRDRGKKKK